MQPQSTFPSILTLLGRKVRACGRRVLDAVPELFGGSVASSRMTSATFDVSPREASEQRSLARDLIGLCTAARSMPTLAQWDNGNAQRQEKLCPVRLSMGLLIYWFRSRSGWTFWFPRREAPDRQHTRSGTCRRGKSR